jgi:hydrogenase maturation protease
MKRILVAGVGNLFLGDDGFGVAVAQRLLAGPAWPGVTFLDAGIRGLDLAYRLLDPLDLLVLVDATTRGDAPGTLYLLEPEVFRAGDSSADAHGMNLPAVFATLTRLGGSLPRTLLLGCEPADLDERLGLSPPVERAVDSALAMLHELLRREIDPTAATAAENDPTRR